MQMEGVVGGVVADFPAGEEIGFDGLEILIRIGQHTFGEPTVLADEAGGIEVNLAYEAAVLAD